MHFSFSCLKKKIIIIIIIIFLSFFIELLPDWSLFFLDFFNGWFCSYADENSGVQKEMDMGDLFDSLSGTGFSAKRKRSVTPNKSEVSDLRYLARFRRIPAIESEEDSE